MNMHIKKKKKKVYVGADESYLLSKTPNTELQH